MSDRRRGAVRWGILIAGFWLLMAVGAVSLGIGLWVRRNFGVISVDQLLSNLQGGGGDGAGGTELVESGVLIGLVAPLTAVIVLLVLVERSRRVLHRHRELEGARRRWFRVAAALVAVAVPVAGGGYLGATVGAGDYVRAVAREAATGTGIADYYVAPTVHDWRGSGDTLGDFDAGEQPRNLVIVYLESIEETFRDADRFGQNMLAPVDHATHDWASLPSLRQYDGGGWTMSGIVATQCGIPLRTAASVADNTELNLIGSEGREVSAYLPGAMCLGDVLAEEGYRNVYMGGADASFAGKGAFFDTHGYDEVHDLQEWWADGETETRPDWGLSDRRLFTRAKAEVSRLHEADEPFNLTLLTLDTHETPYLYDYCEATTPEELTAITDCSMRQVQGFVTYLDEQGILEDTTVVLMGDHLKLMVEGRSFWDAMQGVQDRTIYNRVWVPGGVDFAREDIDQLSIYPTLLELTGLEISEHRAGMGVSALAPADEVPEGSILDLTPTEYGDIVSSRSSAFYRELWGETPEEVGGSDRS